MLALMRKTLAIERLENDLHLLLEQFPIGVLVEHRRAEGFHLARVIAAADAEDGAPFGENVGAGEILGQPQRVPHRRDVEAAADPEVLGQVAEMHRRHQQVGNDLVALVLEMMLRQPQRVPAGFVHHPGDRLGLLEDAGEMRVGEPPLVEGVVSWPRSGRSTCPANTVENLRIIVLLSFGRRTTRCRSTKAPATRRTSGP